MPLATIINHPWLCALAVAAVTSIAGIAYVVVADPVPLYMATICSEESFERSDEAARLYKSVLTKREKTFGSDSEWLVSPLRGLARFYSRYGNDAELKEAESYFKRALQIKEKHSKKSDPQRLDIEVDLASLYIKRKEPEKAEPLLEDALQEGGEDLNAKFIAHISRALADAYTQQGKYENAEPLYEAIVPIEDKEWGRDSFDAADAREHLAQVYTKLGKYDKAEPLFQSALQEFRTETTPHYQKYLAASMTHHADLLRKTGRYSEAHDMQLKANAIESNIPAETQ
jgi:tetratricopeptide (TPR) repeat protein